MVPKKDKKVCLFPSILLFVLKWWILVLAILSAGVVSWLHFSLFPKIFEPFQVFSVFRGRSEAAALSSTLGAWMDWWTDGLYNLTFCSFLNMNAVAQLEEKWSYYWVLRNTILSFEWQNTDLFLIFIFQFPLPFCTSNCAWCLFLLIFKWTFSGFCIGFFVSCQQRDGEDSCDLLSWVWIVPLFSARPSSFIKWRGSLLQIKCSFTLF